MAVADSSIEPKLLDSAKREFLARGFELASLKDICESAEVTTGALYKRYKSKEELFAAVVKETVDNLEEARIARSEFDFDKLSDKNLKNMWIMNKESLLWWFKLFEKHREGITLLLNCSAGTRYSNFKHDFVEQAMEAGYILYEEMKRRKITKKQVSRKMMHTVYSAYFEMVYEPYVHNFTQEEILETVDIMMDFFSFEKFIGIR